MTLYATVAETRASMTEGENGTWSFAFTANDKIMVNNDAVNTYYTFTNNGTNFTSSDAKTTSAPASWYAYFPSNEVNLANQSGDFSGVANYYALSGSTSATTTGIEGLSINMTPQVAVLRIVKVDNSGECDINVKIGDNWVSSLTAKTNEVGFNVTTSTSKVSLLNKNGDAAGTYYYVAVPAGVKIAIYNGNTMLKSTKEAGLTAGKYYTVTTAPVSGSENATINGSPKQIEWVQLWAGGPKFAKKNVNQKMKWEEAAKTGDNYIWGKNWRTPTKEDMNGFIKNGYEVNTDNVKVVYTLKNGLYGLEFTGVQPGYTKSTLFFPSDVQNPDYGEGIYLTSSNGQAEHGLGSGFMYSNQELYFYTTDKIHYDTNYNVRPVLAN